MSRMYNKHHVVPYRIIYIHIYIYIYISIVEYIIIPISGQRRTAFFFGLKWRIVEKEVVVEKVINSGLTDEDVRRLQHQAGEEVGMIC